MKVMMPCSAELIKLLVVDVLILVKWGLGIGNWLFPNGTRVPNVSGTEWDIYRTSGQMVVSMHHRRGGEEGIYRCEIADAMNVTETIYIGVYSASTGEWR